MSAPAGPGGLPPPSALTLRPATDAEKLACWRANSVAWAGKLPTTEAYIARETLNGEHARVVGGGSDQGMIYWVLVEPRPDAIDGADGQRTSGAGEREIYSACETLRRPFVMKARPTGADGADVCVEGWGYGIASVFTPPRYRGKGYASFMMERLAAWFDGLGNEHDRPAAGGSDSQQVPFSVLYSDVGDFYAHLGWPSYPTLEACLPATAQPASTPAATTASVKPLASADLPSLCKQDTATMTAHVRDSPLPPGIDARVLFLPTFEQASWHLGAEEFIAESIFPHAHDPSVRVEVKGAIGASGRTWAYWVHDFSDNKLTLLRTVSPLLPGHEREASGSEEVERELTEELADVLCAAQAEAARWGLEKVTVWNPDGRTRRACARVLGLASGDEVKLHERLEGSIPCLRWKGGKAAGMAPEKVEWVALEKYTWC